MAHCIISRRHPPRHDYSHEVPWSESIRKMHQNYCFYTHREIAAGASAFNPPSGRLLIDCGGHTETKRQIVTQIVAPHPDFGSILFYRVLFWIVEWDKFTCRWHIFLLKWCGRVQPRIFRREMVEKRKPQNNINYTGSHNFQFLTVSEENAATNVKYFVDQCNEWKSLIYAPDCGRSHWVGATSAWNVSSGKFMSDTKCPTVWNFIRKVCASESS